MRRLILLLLVAAAFHPVTEARPAVTGVLSPAWSLDGTWTGVATDEKTGVMRALGRDRIAATILRLATTATPGKHCDRAFRQRREEVAKRLRGQGLHGGFRAVAAVAGTWHARR